MKLAQYHMHCMTYEECMQSHTYLDKLLFSSIQSVQIRITKWKTWLNWNLDIAKRLNLAWYGHMSWVWCLVCNLKHTTGMLQTSILVVFSCMIVLWDWATMADKRLESCSIQGKNMLFSLPPMKKQSFGILATSLHSCGWPLFGPVTRMYAWLTCMYVAIEKLKAKGSCNVEMDACTEAPASTLNTQAYRAKLRVTLSEVILL